MAPGVPNYFTVLLVSHSFICVRISLKHITSPRQCTWWNLPQQAELSATFNARSIREIQPQSYVALYSKRAVAADFNGIGAGFFDNKVVNDKCGS